MNEVTLTIGQRSYTVACADGQEPHVRAMGAEVHERLRRLGGNLSHNDTKNMLFAALILADELAEERRKEGGEMPPSTSATPDHMAAEAMQRIATLEEELHDARDEQDRLRQHLANANERLARASQRGAHGSADVERLAMQIEGLADSLEKSASVLETARRKA